MGWLPTFGSKAVSGPTGASVDEIYPLSIMMNPFVRADIYTTYTKILTDVLERTHGLDDDKMRHFWDNCLQSESPQGIISLLVEAMYSKTDLYIVYNSQLDVVRRALQSEKDIIKADYEKFNSSNLGCYVSFKNYHKTDMLRIFSEMEYCILRGLHKSVNLTRAVQIKMSNMRSSVALIDSEIVIAQAKAIAKGLADGDDVLVDKEDEITSSSFDIGPVEKSIEFTNMKRAFYLGLPMSYISGIQTAGIGSTGEGDNRAVERGLKTFFYSIIQPVIKALFDVETTYRSSDVREIANSLEALKTFDLVSDNLLSKESKDDIIAMLFDLDPEKEREAKEKEAAARGSSTTLNGAQVTAMSQFLAQLSTGQLAPETAIQSLMVSFNLPREVAEDIVDPMKGFTPRPKV